MIIVDAATLLLLMCCFLCQYATVHCELPATGTMSRLSSSTKRKQASASVYAAIAPPLALSSSSSNGSKAKHQPIYDIVGAVPGDDEHRATTTKNSNGYDEVHLPAPTTTTTGTFSSIGGGGGGGGEDGDRLRNGSGDGLPAHRDRRKHSDH